MLRPALAAVDHLILAAPRLADGIAFVHERLGVTARYAGRHPDAGTEAARVSLGGRSYLEILAPAPDQELASSLTALRALPRPTLWGWAIATDDAGAVGDRADQLGIVHPPAGSRAPADATYVRWRNLAVQLALGEAAPSFIEWGPGSRHPSADAPEAARLHALTVLHPSPDAAHAALARLGYHVEVAHADAPGLAVVLITLDGATVVLR